MITIANSEHFVLRYSKMDDLLASNMLYMQLHFDRVEDGLKTLLKRVELSMKELIGLQTINIF